MVALLKAFVDLPSWEILVPWTLEFGWFYTVDSRAIYSSPHFWGYFQSCTRISGFKILFSRCPPKLVHQVIPGFHKVNNRKTFSPVKTKPRSSIFNFRWAAKGYISGLFVISVFRPQSETLSHNHHSSSLKLPRPRGPYHENGASFLFIEINCVRRLVPLKLKSSFVCQLLLRPIIFQDLGSEGVGPTVLTLFTDITEVHLL